MQRLATPVLFLIFNRPDTTKKVFEAIRAARPKVLYVAADGPRQQVPGEREKCQETRSVIKVDWDCDVRVLFREENIGCGRAISSAISWFFQDVEEGIILEDDCLPHPDFFPYCSEMLERYRDDKRIAVISGDNFQQGKKFGDTSYYFSALGNIWGWATWKRTWNNYRFDMNRYDPATVRADIARYFQSWFQKKYWWQVFLRMRSFPIDTWDYQLVFSIWANQGLSIIPNINLVSNIGFDERATHTKKPITGLSDVKTGHILPINHARTVALCREADAAYHKNNIGASGLLTLFCETTAMRILGRQISARLRSFIKKTAPFI